MDGSEPKLADGPATLNFPNDPGPGMPVEIFEQGHNRALEFRFPTLGLLVLRELEPRGYFIGNVL